MKITQRALEKLKAQFIKDDAPNCCANPKLDRKRTGANEVESWAVFKCQCGKNWYLYHNRGDEGFTTEEPII